MDYTLSCSKDSAFYRIHQKKLNIFAGMFSFRLPKKLFDITIESWLFRPAGIFDELTDVLLHVGSHGAGAVVVFVVALRE